MIPESFVQDLLARIDITDVISRHVTLRKRGANLVGLCPFHGEKTPSFTVSPAKQFYHCFGCGASGNAISFYIQHLGVNFPEAVRMLAREAGLTVPEPNKSPRQRRYEKQQRQVRTIYEQYLQKAQEFYHQQLVQTPAASKYLRQRGLGDDVVQHFKIGWAPNEWQALARVFDNYQANELQEVGLVAQGREGRQYDRFRGRIMFPIRNQRGHTIGFGGRLIVAGEPKYLNSPETTLFSKGQELYGLWEARQDIHRAGFVLVVEGYMDVVSLAQQGFYNAVATLGTATTSQHLQRLTRHTNKIVFCFDADKAGQVAAWRAVEHALPLLRDDLSLHFMFLPQGHDPDSYVQKYGMEAFHVQIEQAVVFSKFFLEQLQKKHNLELVEGRAACVHDALPFLAKLPETNFSKQLCQAFAQQVRLTPSELSQQLKQYISKQRRFAAYRKDQGTSSHPDRAKNITRNAKHRSQGLSSQSVPFHSDQSLSPAKEKYKQTAKTTRSVVPLARRMLRLLVVYPELSAKINTEQLEIIVQSPHLVYVQELIGLINDTGCAHSGAVLQAIDKQSELAAQLKKVSFDVAENEVLPNPQAEWEDALKQIEIESIKDEQLRLIEQSPMGVEEKKRYQLLTRRLAELTTARGI